MPRYRSSVRTRYVAPNSRHPLSLNVDLSDATLAQLIKQRSVPLLIISSDDANTAGRLVSHALRGFHKSSVRTRYVAPNSRHPLSLNVDLSDATLAQLIKQRSVPLLIISSDDANTAGRLVSHALRGFHKSSVRTRYVAPNSRHPRSLNEDALLRCDISSVDKTEGRYLC